MRSAAGLAYLTQSSSKITIASGIRSINVR
jgi:hypothetical protein